MRHTRDIWSSVIENRERETFVYVYIERLISGAFRLIDQGRQFEASALHIEIRGFVAP